jgi:hypothetical protein
LHHLFPIAPLLALDRLDFSQAVDLGKCIDRGLDRLLA